MKRAFFIAAAFGILGILSLPRLSGAAQAAPLGHENEQETVLHVETREAVIDVVARDRRNLPIANLTADELEVREVTGRSSAFARRILSFRIVEPERVEQAEESTNGFHVSSGAVCALNALVHYQIAIPASSEPGLHSIVVETTRPNVHLSYRRQYYVGLRRENATPKALKALVTPTALQEAACYHPLTPPTLAITGKVLDAPGGKGTRYAVVIQPQSLRDIGVSEGTAGVQLDFGICTFDSSGEVTNYLHSTVDHQLNDTDMARVQTHGFLSLLEAPGEDPPALARLVVLDRNTGNLGIVDVSKPLTTAAQAGEAKKKQKLIGDIRAFGSVAPGENAFCGDVYEIPEYTTSVTDLQELNPVGSIYTNVLDVPDQDITRMGGIPGITHSSTWFGIDYYGKFYVSKAGNYGFSLDSDDGSRLEIDDLPVIGLDGVHPDLRRTAKVTLTAGWHSIHVPYFQGPPVSLALVLMIKPPGEHMRPFNLNEFVPAKKP